MSADLLPILPTEEEANVNFFLHEDEDNQVILPSEEEANINLFPHEEANFVSPEPGFFMDVDNFFMEGVEEEDNHVILPTEEDANVNLFLDEDEDNSLDFISRVHPRKRMGC
ncbi:hypothetical protein PR003_g19869 [Phytophthora rubi]|uniref:Uncharacterized protein n=1 Tax=Phytophthora rubi TaxID=129364 RepID=A0A6A4DP79_9STRA|nr:hypothetical protein PR003_g19869 [Phytophthora rubi]